MKTHLSKSTATAFLTSFFLPLLNADETTTSSSFKTSESSTSTSSNGNQSDITKKSVTVTSDGENTVRRIVTMRDDVETVVTETTDKNGKVTIKRDEAEPVAPDPNRPWLGLRVQAISRVLRGQLDLADDEGLVVDVVAPRGPAAKAGIVAGDLLLRLSDQPVASSELLLKETLKHKIGDTLSATIMRKGKRGSLDITLGKKVIGPRNPPEDLTDKFPKRPQGAIEVRVENNENGEALDAILADPDVPKQFKENVRKMQERLRNFEKQHGIK
jgi:hypothetical protein